LVEQSSIIRLKWEMTSSESEVEERRPEARDTAARRWLKAITEAGLAWRSNSSNSFSASSRPRIPERARPAMMRSSSKHRSRTVLTQRDMPTVRG
jgi:hypothetical protein